MTSSYPSSGGRVFNLSLCGSALKVADLVDPGTELGRELKKSGSVAPLRLHICMVRAARDGDDSDPGCSSIRQLGERELNAFHTGGSDSNNFGPHVAGLTAN
jgi:hypothetical protein